MTRRRLLLCWLVYGVLSSCASFDSPSTTDHAVAADLSSTPRQALAQAPIVAATISPAEAAADEPGSVTTPTAATTTRPVTSAAVKAPPPLLIEKAGQTGQIENPALDEISGLAVSRQVPGVLFAVNDSGNAAELYAMSETGADLAHWKVNARNRDWEDMATLHLDGRDYLVLADTGDNRQTRQQSALYLIEEPSLDTPATTVLEPVRTLRFHYEDGPRNVEAMAISDNIVYLISKEPIGPSGARASRLYTLTLPGAATDELLVAQFAGELPLQPANLEARLAAAVAGVDLNHPTSLDFDEAGNTAYLLTYRHVIRIRRRTGESWVDALTSRAERFHSHTLWQAEALAASPDQTIWLTSENAAAPLWALPARPPS
ncbi:hypothetical protein ACUNV4_12740 [Granulosicoccus sp. 3-233]|uniref:hypothetical protein n=1 Tax=Granulosicoccus sp. 3-233 TaxID=3417969 RepID=UPI003D32DA0B